MAWFSTGTVQVVGGSPNLVFTGANLLTSNGAIAGMAIQIEGSDKDWELLQIGGDNAATLSANWAGADASGLTFKIVPIRGFQVDLANKLVAMAAAMAMFTALPAAASDGDYMQFIGSDKVPTNRTAVQVATDLSNKIAEVTVASASNTNIGAAASPQVEVSGTTTITSFNPASGTLYPNAIRYVRFSGALTLTNGTTLVLPGSADIATQAGDWAIFKSDGSPVPVWRCISYQPADGRMVNMTGATFDGTLVATNISDSNPVALGSVAGFYRIDSAGAAGRHFRCIGADGSVEGINVSEIGNGALCATVGSDGSFLLGTATLGGWSGSAKLESKGAIALSGWCVSGGDIAVQARCDNSGGYAFAAYYSTSLVGTITFTGGGTGVAYNTTSDARLKTVCAEQGDYRAAIQALWVGDFIWKENGASGFGVLAQQAYDVMPNHQGVTKPVAEDGAWNASAEPFGHLALWGVKDLYVMVDGLSVVVDDHARELEDLKRRVAELEAKQAA